MQPTEAITPLHLAVPFAVLLHATEDSLVAQFSLQPQQVRFPTSGYGPRTTSAIGACMPRCRWAATRPVDAAPGASLRFRAACGVVERCAGVAECDTRGSASERKQQRVIGTRPPEPCVAGPADVASARRSAVARIRLRLKLKRRRGDGIRVHCRMDS